MVAGATLSLLLIAAPLLFLAGPRHQPVSPSGVAPLAALATLPDEPTRFDISSILPGEWVGEVCPDDGAPVPVRFEFVRAADDSVSYSLSVGGQVVAADWLGSGTCDVDGEDIAFHGFLAVLSDCDEACGVDRLYEGHFDDGVLTGSYSDVVDNDDCLSCLGGGTWWLEPGS
jgi:hypothetical protein